MFNLDLQRLHQGGGLLGIGGLALVHVAVIDVPLRADAHVAHALSQLHFLVAAVRRETAHCNFWQRHLLRVRSLKLQQPFYKKNIF